MNRHADPHADDRVAAPRISVCLLAFNHAHVIESTVASVLEQTLADVEILLSDDCSTDGTWDALRRIEQRDARVRAIRTPHNLGMAEHANFAVARSSGEFIALLHHDDLYRPDLLEKWAGVLERHPDAGFVFNCYGEVDGDRICGAPMPGECIDGDWLLERHLFARWGCLIRGTAMIRRSAWLREGGMRAAFGLLADVDLWMRLAMRGPVGYVDEPLITVRHARPSYYPDIYKGGTWSWTRLRLLYEIHAANRSTYLRRKRFAGRLRWLAFRYRLSAETAKWIVYALVRRKYPMLRSCGDSRTAYDVWPLRAFRALLLHATRFLPST
ncbi:glycosyltransferase family A protein [Dokdonella sp.]|uniref:glycosyltransferase family 2 protein n=1 Tax=Dokdonella sp. TaxID=2291710 RepID=UPI002F40EFE9